MRPADPARVVELARAWIGTPYHDQASLRGAGCDCLGLARGVWRDLMGPEPEAIPPYTRDWGEIAPTEAMALGASRWMLPGAIPPAAGDLILFRMMPGAIAKHCGIATGGGFVHAAERIGVVEAPLTLAWARRIAFAFRFPARLEF